MENMPKEPREFRAWTRRLKAMKRCSTAKKLLAKHGQPAHKVKDAGVEIWHYPLGIAGGALYSIHVAIEEDAPPMAYMALELTDQPDTTAPRPWWKFWQL
jgi:hypothetical protein